MSIAAERYARFMELRSREEVREASRAPSPAAQLKEEASRLRDRIPAGEPLVALDSRTGRAEQ